MGTIAITGASSGIGKATRDALEAAGHTIIGIDIAGSDVSADLSNDEGQNAAVAAVLEASNGTLDGLVTAAGLGPPKPAAAIARVNYFGSQAVLAGLRPALARSERSQVVQIGSNSTTTTPNVPDELVAAMIDGDEAGTLRQIEAFDPIFGMALAYAGSKTAITRWCRRAATTADWIGSGIRLNVIAPGAVATPLLAAGQNDENFGPMMEAFPIPAGEPADPTLIAEWIVFMLSPAAAFLVGSVIFVDGGTDALLRPDDWPTSFTL